MGALIAGGCEARNKVEVFNPNTKRVCSLPDMPGGQSMDFEHKGTLCGNLLCSTQRNRKCFKWENGIFVQSPVTLVTNRYQHLCWALDNGVLLLGGFNEPKERF